MLSLTGYFRQTHPDWNGATIWAMAIDMSVIFLLAGSLALGAALEKTEITTLLAESLTSLHATAHPLLIVAAFLFSAVIISEFMSNSGTVPLLAPVAIAVANKTGIEPMALIAAITYGSTAAFAMPIGYQTSLMIFGIGGYRVKDFVRMGIALIFYWHCWLYC